MKHLHKYANAVITDPLVMKAAHFAVSDKMNQISKYFSSLFVYTPNIGISAEYW
jgi:hypothetical protein